MTSKHTLQHVTVLTYPKVLGTSITIPVEMLHSADLIARINSKNQPPLNIELVNTKRGNATLTGGLELVCSKTPADIQHTDLIIVPALWGNPLGIVRQETALKPWLNEQNSRETLICAIGTGSYFLAEAGLLRNKVATTHWYYFNHFTRFYPDITLQKDRFITRAGNIFCTGSVNSVRDVMLFIIEEFYDAGVADQVSRHYTHEIKRSHTSQLLRAAPQHSHDDETIIEIQQWLHNFFSTDISLAVLAENFGLSIRTLNRRFRTATGKTPVQYLQQIRMDNARELLKTSNLSVSEIAYNVGYPDNSYFSALFRKVNGLSPKAYRQLVRKKQFNLET